MQIISLSKQSWSGGPLMSRQGLCMAFSKLCRVLYAWETQHLLARGWRGLLEVPGALEVSPMLTVYRPPQCLSSIPWRPRLDSWLTKRRIRCLRRAADRQPDNPRVLYIWEPTFVHYVGAFGEDLVCYHVYDLHSAFAANEEDRKRVVAAEKRLLARADVVVTASRSLAECLGVGNRAVHCPAGVDQRFIDRVEGAAGMKPADLPSGGPIIGYSGALNSKLDLDVLEELAVARPDWHIVTVGRMALAPDDAERFERLTSRPNFHYLGSKPWDRLHEYVMAFDVALMCFRETAWTRFCEVPLKAFEYMAAGKPVVGSALPYVNNLEGLILRANSPQEFVQKVEQALAEDCASLAARRVAVAKQNTWDSRARVVMNAIKAQLAAKGFCAE